VSHLIDTVLLLALPASGKSEVRTFLATLAPEESSKEFGLGPTVQLDDYPYVHLMRRIDEELEASSSPTLFFGAQDKPFVDPRDWGTLIELINEDYRDLHEAKVVRPESAAAHLFARLEKAAQLVGIGPRLATLDGAIRDQLGAKLEAECVAMLEEKHANYPDILEGKTIVIEFARGGPDGASIPLKAPFGYRYSLSRLSAQILQRASILYVWVTPEESRRKNDERARPDEQGSILHHGVPIEVMLKDYGCDDIEDLISCSGQVDRVLVEAGDERFTLPISRFDNRVDKTSFVRKEQRSWEPTERKALHDGLAAALLPLARG